MEGDGMNEKTPLLQEIRNARREARNEKRREVGTELEKTQRQIEELQAKKELLEAQLSELQSGEDRGDDLYRRVLSGNEPFESVMEGETA